MRLLVSFTLVCLLAGAGVAHAQSDSPDSQNSDSADASLAADADAADAGATPTESTYVVVMAIPTSTPVPTAVPVATTVYSTRNGPRTEDQLHQELSLAGYPGPWDVSSMLRAYGDASEPHPPAATPIPVQVPALQRSDFSGACLSQATTINAEAFVALGPLFALADDAATLDQFCLSNAARDGSRGVQCSGTALSEELELAAVAVRAGASSIPSRASLYTNCFGR